MRYSLVLGLAGAVVAGGLAIAQTAPAVSIPADTIVAARKAGFDLQAGVVGGMKTAIDGGTDVKGLTDGAKGLAAWGPVIPGMFPDGTQKANGTKAKAEIWTDRAGFEKANAAFLAASEKFVLAAKSGDKAAFADAWKAEGQSCGGCHRNYKEK